MVDEERVDEERVDEERVDEERSRLPNMGTAIGMCVREKERERLCVCVCIYTYIHSCVCVCVCVYECMYARACVHVRVLCISLLTYQCVASPHSPYQYPPEIVCVRILVCIVHIRKTTYTHTHIHTFANL